METSSSEKRTRPPDNDVPTRRSMCARCRRPARVCLCAALPAHPIETEGEVLVLQHPHERRNRLATVPLLELCLARCSVLGGRRFRPTSHDAISRAVCEAREGACPLLVLFPTPDCLTVAEAADELWGRRDGLETANDVAAGEPCASGPAFVSDPAVVSSFTAADSAVVSGSTATDPSSVVRGSTATDPAVVSNATATNPADVNNAAASRAALPRYRLLAIDGTWQQAREMASASLPLLVPPGSCVRLDSREIAEEEDHALRLRMEPVPGCSTTAEAVARALGGLESSSGAMESVLEALKQMTALQAEFDPATLARSRGQGAMFATGRNKFGMNPTLQRAVAGGERT